MKTRGTKVLDYTLETAQIEWLVVSAAECPDVETESRIARTHFRVPHEAWTSPRAFVQPVSVRRSRSRVLFLQESGLALQ